MRVCAGSKKEIGMNKKLLGLILIIGVLAGCFTETPEEAIARQRNQLVDAKKNCASFGYDPDTTEMHDCVQNLYRLAEQKYAQSIDEQRARIREVGSILQKTANPPSTPSTPSSISTRSSTSTTCTTSRRKGRNGETINCTTW